MRRFFLLFVFALAAAPALAQGTPAAGIPARPEKIAYPPFSYTVPDAATYRHTLKSGVPVYVVEDHALPLATISLTFRGGAFLEQEPGVASLTGTLMRQGGAAARNAIEFDERADFLATSVSAFVGDTSAGASINTLSANLGPSLDLLFDMLQAPRFEEARLAIEKGSILESMKQRNDDAAGISGREWSWLMYGRDHYSTRQLTQAQLDAISRDDLVDFHRRFVRPENLAVIAVSGDVDAKAVVAELDRRFAGWKPQGKAEAVAWPPPAPKHEAKPGVYYVEKDIPQGRVLIGHAGTTWKDPDHLALQVMNHILGGGSFTSRITKRVRSDEGLAYSAGSQFGVGTWWPSVFRVAYQSKSPTVALAARLSLDEMKRMVGEPVSEDELAVAKGAIIESFPRRFESPAQIAAVFAEDEFLGRPHAYWTQYQDAIRKISAADVQRVAKQHLHPDGAVILIVGKWGDIEPGDPGKRAAMAQFGPATRLPLRDPLTLEPLP